MRLCTYVTHAVEVKINMWVMTFDLQATPLLPVYNPGMPSGVQFSSIALSHFLLTSRQNYLNKSNVGGVQVSAYGLIS
jgi:hypothetical protein